MDFPGNSHNSQNEQPKDKKDIQKVVTGDVVQKPKTVGRKFKGIFFNGEFKAAMRYILSDVMLPAFKNVIVDATSKGIERVVYGDSSARRRYAPQQRPSYSYNRPLDRPRTVMLPDQPPYSNPRQRRQDVSDIILHSKEEAEVVLERLSDIINQYDVATVADLLSLVGLPSSYVDNKWGWTRLGGMSVRQVREGYLLDLPAVEAI